jgi:hypothetical protein
MSGIFFFWLEFANCEVMRGKLAFLRVDSLLLESVPPILKALVKNWESYLTRKANFELRDFGYLLAFKIECGGS